MYLEKCSCRHWATLKGFEGHKVIGSDLCFRQSNSVAWLPVAGEAQGKGEESISTIHQLQGNRRSSHACQRIDFTDQQGGTGPRLSLVAVPMLLDGLTGEMPSAGERWLWMYLVSVINKRRLAAFSFTPSRRLRYVLRRPSLSFHCAASQALPSPHPLLATSCPGAVGPSPVLLSLPWIPFVSPKWPESWWGCRLTSSSYACKKKM